MTSVFLTFLEYQICLVLGITSWLFAITAYQKTLFHKDFPAFWPSNILVETCWHLQFWRFVVGPFSYLVHVLYIGFDLLLAKQRSWQDLSKSGWRIHSPPPPNLNILLLWPMCVQSSHSARAASQRPERVIVLALRSKNYSEKSLALLGYGWIIYINMAEVFYFEIPDLILVTLSSILLRKKDVFCSFHVWMSFIQKISSICSSDYCNKYISTIFFGFG